MNRLKEVTVFTNGDSSKPSTWSNVPYFFTEALLSKGITVNRVDLQQHQTLKKLFNRNIKRIKKITKSTSSYDYYRSSIHFYDVTRRIKSAIAQHPNTDANIFLTFSFSACGLTNKPSVQLCDWTYAHYIDHFLDRQPDYFERQCIRRENAKIESSDFVFSLFPSVTQKMKAQYQNKNIFYLGNVINAGHGVSPADAVALKSASNSIVFIGGTKYKAGALSLIQAFTRVRSKNPSLCLHIVGLETKDLGQLPENVFCYGYLDKGIESAKATYYKLLLEAKAIVNTTPKWGAFSATIEAMYFYTPVITSPYDDFVETFGKDIPFGYYCAENTPEAIAEKLSSIIHHPEYASLCLEAHDAVSQFTWDAYVDRMLQTIESTAAQDLTPHDA